ncbi:transporter substrate-binding domain-containing protein [Legionella nagasakiensis]|uniref:transporter substrate-binding domain-containing protein n=1 Tax=Legionella nagasakiensis TaxID=535290 RepID=UPI0013EFA993|nr:transporter substrate-binding domain-containing protein [Legionella nagasakiensis]
MLSLLRKLDVLFFFSYFVFLSTATNAKTLRIGVVDFPPYSYYVPNEQKPIGIAIELWEEIARNLKIKDYQYIRLNANFNKHIRELKEGKYDIIATPFYITKGREEAVDFSRALFVGTSTVLLKKEKPHYLSSIKYFFASTFILFAILYTFLFFIYSHWLWYLERGKTLPHNYKEFIDAVMWRRLIFGMLQNMPKKWSARILELLWKTSGYILFSLLISYGGASIIIFTTHLYEVQTIDELRNKKIAAIKGSELLQNARKHNLNPILINSFEEGLKLIEQDKIDGVFMDKAQAQYFIYKKNLNNLYIPPILIGQNLAAFPVQPNYPLLDLIDQTILNIQDSGFTTFICHKYLGSQSRICIGN